MVGHDVWFKKPLSCLIQLLSNEIMSNFILLIYEKDVLLWIMIFSNLLMKFEIILIIKNIMYKKNYTIISYIGIVWSSYKTYRLE